MDVVPRETWLEVTPILSDPFGTPTPLQTVRYRIDPELAPLYGQGFRNVTPSINLNGYPNGAMNCSLVFHVEVKWADTPTPEVVSTVEPQQPYDYPGLRS